MSEIVIFIIVGALIGIVLLGRYIIIEKEKMKRRKKFWENLKNN